MKFLDGYWGLKKGVELAAPAEIRDYEIKEGLVRLYLATRPVNRRGDTLNSALLTIEYTSPAPDVIGVKIIHFKGLLPVKPAFELSGKEGFKPDIEDSEDKIVIRSGKLTAVIKKAPGWSVDFLHEGRRLTGNSQKSTGYLTVKDEGVFMREQLELGVGEYIYGLGERFTPFVKNGQTVDIWNEDGGTSTEQSYKNVPFYLSNRGYGVFVNHSEKVSYEVGSETVSKVQFSVPGEKLEYFVIGGGTPKDALSNYTLFTGRPALPPAWSFGLWLTTSFTTSYDEQTVTGFIEGMAERDIPLHVFHFDCFWMKEFQWCDFVWDKDVFPDPEAMLKRLKARGLKICVWINSYIAQKSRLFDEGMEKGYLVKNRDGSVWQWDRWQAGMGLVDFTNPDAVKWYQNELKKLMDMGVDCFKTDFGERIPTDVVYFDGSDPVKMHNYYTYLYNKAVFEVLEENRGKHDAAVFARSATAGGQKFPVHWGGDCSANYDSMAESLRGGLSLCASGFGFWSHDISGFERTAPPDIYKRWSAFGLLSTHSRLHGNESYRVPWLFDEESVDVLRFFTRLKCSLMPYLFSKAVEAAQEGIPAMRPMVLEFPEDPAALQLDRQYMLGDGLLVAPIFNNEGRAQYYLPKGTWTHLLTGEKAEGGSWREEEYGYLSLPLFVRENTVLAVGSVDDKPDYDYADGVELRIYELKEGATAQTSIFNTNGEEELVFTAQRENNTVTLKAEGKGKPWKAVLVGIPSVAKAEGASSAKGEKGLEISPENGVKQVVITL